MDPSLLLLMFRRRRLVIKKRRVTPRRRVFATIPSDAGTLTVTQSIIIGQRTATQGALASGRFTR